MKSSCLYIASLRVVINRELVNSEYKKQTHKHLRYVLVESKDMCTFKDVQTNQKYATDFTTSNTAILPGHIVSFNDLVDNGRSHITKRKALKLFDEKVR